MNKKEDIADELLYFFMSIPFRFLLHMYMYIMYMYMYMYMCDGTRKLHLLYSRVWSTVLAYNYVVIVTFTRCRSCIDIAYKWREGLGLECCARPHVFSVNKSLPWNVLLKYLCESDEGLPE